MEVFRSVLTVADSRRSLVALCRIIDLDPLITDRKRTILFWACFIYPFFFHAFSLYTLYYYRNDMLPFLQCVSMWGAAGQCSFKTINAYIHRKRIREMFDQVTCKQSASEQDERVNAHYLKWARRLSVILKMLTSTLLSNFVFFNLYLLRGIVVNDRKFIFVLNIPGLNADPNAGFPDYELQLTFQLVALWIGVWEVVALDGLFAYFALNGASQADSLIVTINRMSQAVEEERAAGDETSREIKRIIQQHGQYLDYINRLDEMFNGMFLMQFGSFAFSGSVALYVARISDWFAIYGIIATSYFQLFFYNSLGSVIETKNHEIAEEFYNCKWFMMSIKDRKMIMLMLQRARTVPTLSVGHLAPLNLETGMSIYKTLYSYFLLLKDAFN
ncbi:odorant receptor 67d-like [Phlebotomus argentipes]|uniref:odorant receptor 67d-like n=1 Tax=Phlebotomus argentipes TaxID=94469 RepID=UPI0028937D70|nr:odorant receptor 67d-like [Phlebotomus argentipes]